MPSPFFIADASVKGVPLSALPDSAWRYLVGSPEDGETLSPLAAFRRVAFMFRGVDIRAKAVQKMPYALMRGDVDVTDDPRYVPIQRSLSHLLYRTEAALCLYGRSYWKKESNAFGLNITPRWLLPTSITPRYDPVDGLTGFVRTLGTASAMLLDVADVVYVWTPNLEAEIGPGVAPVTVALYAAGVLHSQDVYIDGYFKRGALKATLLSVEGNPPPQEMEKLEKWWKRMISGVRNAWTTVAIRAAVKPIVIGDGLKDTISVAMTDQARQDIATALGVPLSLMKSDALAGGVADAEQLNFYDQTIIPECDLIAEAVNAQWLDAEGLRIAFKPSKIEIFQRVELQRAKAISELVGTPIMTVNEARERLSLPPLLPSETLAPPVHSGTPPAPQPPAAPLALPAPQSEKAVALGLWERKALKRLKERGAAACEFAHDALTPADHAFVLARLAAAPTPADVKAVFHVAQRRGTRHRADAVPLLLTDAVLDKARHLAQEARTSHD